LQRVELYVIFQGVYIVHIIFAVFYARSVDCLVLCLVVYNREARAVIFCYWLSLLYVNKYCCIV